jgi:hypothetical protein
MDTSSPHLTRRRLVAVSVALTMAVACVAAPGTAAASPAPPRQQAVAASAPWSPIIKLPGTMFARSRPVVSYAVKTKIKSIATTWTRQQLNYWYCNRWAQYFGYDRRVWLYWANRYYGPNFAWRYCTAVGYL